MPKYRVKAGSHVEGDKIYRKDEVVSSPHDLVELFEEKFELVPETPATKKVAPAKAGKAAKEDWEDKGE